MEILGLLIILVPLLIYVIVERIKDDSWAEFLSYMIVVISCTIVFTIFSAFACK